MARLFEYRDIFGDVHVVKLIRYSEYTDQTALCLLRDREVWIRRDQLTPLDQLEQETKPKQKRWVWGQDPPEHLVKQSTIKQKGRIATN